MMDAYAKFTQDVRERGLLEGGDGDVPDPRKAAWSPRFRDLAEVAFPGGAFVI